ncbi:Wadjet anti-phage system protein JetD domain-containing protein [Dyadobacter sp. 3J3]|uniref:Wadjet anti-phage system protein JetD domain-containing protein n=1 Tax=Dyadobacter sp. 3J3 TaxID=2606600 RepID=UPI00135B3035|nr:Wadjet anti-phage system protein JetD domain-containing protein [Dyadobacter sp. 3J3]
MISPSEIRNKAEKKYLFFLQQIVQGLPFLRVQIPGDKTPSRTLLDLQREISALVSQSKERKGFGYTIDFQTVKTKSIGTQALPINIYFDSQRDFLKYLGKEKEVESLLADIEKILTEFPELKNWICQFPTRVINHQGKWENILKVCRYFKIVPKPDCYVRELPIDVHTKFVESNQGIIREILDIIIQQHVNGTERDFEKRFNLKYSEPFIRFKILDNEISKRYFSNIEDMAVSVSHFKSLNLPVKKVIVVENKTTLYTFLTLPKMDGAIAIFGSGYGLKTLERIDWLTKVDLFYWGDIDAQGFEILSQFRGYFPHVSSVLMDSATYDRYSEHHTGTPSYLTIKLNLTDSEQELYNFLKINNLRLEQEKIPFSYVNEYFQQL